MASVHPTQVPSLVTQMGYKPMIMAYDAEPNVREQIYKIQPVQGWEEGVDTIDIIGPVIPGEIQRGEASPHRTISEGYRRVGKIRKLSESITVQEEQLKNPNADAILGARLSRWMPEMGKGFQIAKEQLAADLFIYGSYTAGRAATFDGSHSGHADPYPKFAYDGKPVFAASGNGHPLYFVPATTLVNQDALAFSSTNVESSRVLMAHTNAVNESNEKIRIDPDVLLVPPQLSRQARVLVNSTLLPGTAQNDENTMKGQYKVIDWRYLTDTDAWFMGCSNKGLVFFDAGAPMIEVSAPDKSTGDVTIRLVSYHGILVEDIRYWNAHATSLS